MVFPYTAFLIFALAYALMIVLAGFAATLTSLPNITRVPAFVAGFFRVFMMHRPGIANLPTAFTSFAPKSASAPITLVTSRRFNLNEDAMPSAIPDLDIARTPPAFIDFIAFIAVFGSMAG